MRRPSFIAASIAAMLSFPVLAQQSSQTVPDAPQQQPQKKPAPKSQPAPDASGKDSNGAGDGTASKPSSKDDNAFPEDVSKAAAAKAADAAGSTDSGAKAGQAADGQHSTAGDNPFPEDVSKAAAKAAGNDSGTPAPPHDVPSGVSSSRSSSLDEVTPAKIEADPSRAKKDAEVGGFYLKAGDFQGALARFQDATTYDPTNVDAIFGLAETQRRLKKNADAAKNYQLYLDIVPTGPKSKQALKALKELGSGS
jgi:tetratricopeptide (TPR) repeat protein